MISVVNSIVFESYKGFVRAMLLNPLECSTVGGPKHVVTFSQKSIGKHGRSGGVAKSPVERSDKNSHGANVTKVFFSVDFATITFE